MEEFKYKEGDEITFDNGMAKGKGIIRGVSTVGQPIIGVGYIVEYSEMNVDHEYSCIVVFECHINREN